MRARELEAYFRDRGVRSVADLDARMRVLRSERLIPTGGRGLNAPQIDADVAAGIVLAIIIPDAPGDAGDGPYRAARMRVAQDPTSTNFRQVVRRAISDPSFAAEIAWLRVNQSENSALIEYGDGSQQTFFDWEAFARTAREFPDHLAQGPEADIQFHMPYILTQEITMSGLLLCVIGLMVQGVASEEAEAKANASWCGFVPSPPDQGKG